MNWQTLLPIGIVFFSMQVALALPPSPSHDVADPGLALLVHQKSALETILVEHHRLTREHIQISVLSESETNPDEDAQNLFKDWDCGKKPGGTGAVLAIFQKEKTVRFEAGYGLSSRLTLPAFQDSLQSIFENFPDKKPKILFSQIGQATLELLTLLESPLISDGRALEILNQQGWTSPEKLKKSNQWVAWVALAFLFALGGILFFVGWNRKSQNPHLLGIDTEAFSKQIRQLEKKLKTEVQVQITSAPRKTEAALILWMNAKKKKVGLIPNSASKTYFEPAWTDEFLTQVQSDFRFTHPQRVVQKALATLEAHLSIKTSQKKDIL
jgi:hypothetical protein